MALEAPPSVVFFDLDGCLVDSTNAITGSLNHALEELGLPRRDPGDLEALIGPPLREGAERLIADAGADPSLVSELMRAYRRRYAGVSTGLTTVVPGVPDALERIARRATLGVVTSKPGGFAGPILEATGLSRWFATVHAPPLDERGEPKATTLRRALDELAADGPVAIVGDRRHDVEAGLACGVGTVGVTWGAGPRDELERAAAHAIVETPGELVAVLHT